MDTKVTTVTTEALNAFLDQAITERKEAQKFVTYPPIRRLKGGEFKPPTKKSEKPTAPDGWTPEQN